MCVCVCGWRDSLLHVTPSPTKSGRHSHSKPSLVLIHVALDEQLSSPNSHSSISAAERERGGGEEGEGERRGEREGEGRGGGEGGIGRGGEGGGGGGGGGGRERESYWVYVVNGILGGYV